MVTLIAALWGPLKPVEMIPRQIGPQAPIVGGRTVELKVGENSATLFVPAKVKLGRLWCHFHTAAWFIVQEFQRGGVNNEPILVFNLGQGSTVYSAPFLKQGEFQRWREQAEMELGWKVTTLGFTSFSAGYGAVRQLVTDPVVFADLSVVLLCDSLYGSIVTDGSRKVVPEHINVWKPIAQKAMDGKAKVIMTTSQITPSSYAGTWEVAQQLVESFGNQMDIVADPKGDEQNLLRTFQRGNWCVWSYAGTTPEAHMTHPRHLAELLTLVK